MARKRNFPVLALATLVSLAIVFAEHARDPATNDVGTSIDASDAPNVRAPIENSSFGPQAKTSAGKLPAESGASPVGATSAGNETEPPLPERVPTEQEFHALMGWPAFADAQSRFVDESKDTGWSDNTRGRLLGLVSELDGLVLNRLEADCRESMCRLELLFPAGKEPIYALRQIYERVGEFELGPAVAETEPGEEDN